MVNNRVKCLIRLLESVSYQEMADFLIENKWAAITDVNSKTRPQERAEFLYISLIEAEKKGDILLLDFEWKVLPLEQIKITCVTTREEKLFTYGY